MQDEPEFANPGEPADFGAGTEQSPAADRKQPPDSVPHEHKDKNGRHVTRHGVLSRHPQEVLAACRENMDQLRRTERMLRAELKPKDTLGKVLFDRAWSSYLRCLLISHTEARLFMPIDPSKKGTVLPQLQEGDFHTLIWPETGAASTSCRTPR